MPSTSTAAAIPKHAKSTPGTSEWQRRIVHAGRRVLQLSGVCFTGLVLTQSAQASPRVLAEIAAGAFISAADTAWMLQSTLVALCALLPALALFHGAFAGARHFRILLLQHAAVLSVVSLMWVAFGYSLAFSTAGMIEGEIGWRSVVGGLSNLGLREVTEGAVMGTFPTHVWVLFQLVFAVLAPCIALTSITQRVKMSAVVVFTMLWSALVYLPVVHSMWAGPGALLGDLGALDFAGGLVVHVTAGFSGLMGATMLRRSPVRASSSETPSQPMLAGGALLMWLGLMTLYAGSALTPGTTAAAALLAAQVCASTAAVTWLLLDWISGRPSVASVCLGAVSGLVCIACGADKVSAGGAALMGSLVAVVSRWVLNRLKLAFGDDMPLAFAIHGVAGFMGHLMTGVLSHPHYGGNQIGIYVSSQLAVQSFSCMTVACYSMLMTGLLLLITRVLCHGILVPDQSLAEAQ